MFTIYQVLSKVIRKVILCAHLQNNHQWPWNKKPLSRHIMGGSVLIGKELWPEKNFQKGLVTTTVGQHHLSRSLSALCHPLSLEEDYKLFVFQKSSLLLAFSDFLY